MKNITHPATRNSIITSSLHTPLPPPEPLHLPSRRRPFFPYSCVLSSLRKLPRLRVFSDAVISLNDSTWHAKTCQRAVLSSDVCTAPSIAPDVTPHHSTQDALTLTTIRSSVIRPHIVRSPQSLQPRPLRRFLRSHTSKCSGGGACATEDGIFTCSLPWYLQSGQKIFELRVGVHRGLISACSRNQAARITGVQREKGQKLAHLQNWRFGSVFNTDQISSPIQPNSWQRISLEFGCS